jgi:O-acetyl-ADP-ribose deacetylase (regulator of RNase III)
MTEQVEYTQGDATAPHGTGPRIIAHVCNDDGGWGKGFVLPLAQRWPQLKSEYKSWYRDRQENDFALGAVQLVRVSEEVYVANMIGQHGYRPGGDVPPVRYPAIAAALAIVGDHARELQASVHMPRIGCGLAGGRWEEIEPLIVTHLLQRDVAVTVYDLP